MKTIWNDYIFGVLIIILYTVYIDCTTNFDTYEIDEEPLSFGQDQSQFDSLTTYQLDSAQHKILDLALVFDSSYTITTSGWYKIKRAAKQLVDGLDIAPQGTHVSLMKFSTDVETFRIFEQDDDKEKIKKEIDNLTYDGEWSRIDLAARALNDHVFSSDSGARLGDVPKAVVLFTDGRTDGQTQPDEEVDWHRKVLDALKPLKDKNVVVYAVAVGAYADQPMLSEITGSAPIANDTLSDQSKSSGRVFELNDIESLVKSLDELSAKVPKVVVTQTTIITTTATTTPVTQVTATATTTVEVPPSSSISAQPPVSPESSPSSEAPGASSSAEASLSIAASSEGASAPSSLSSAEVSATASSSPEASIGASSSPDISITPSATVSAGASSSEGTPPGSSSAEASPVATTIAPSASASSVGASAAASSAEPSSSAGPESSSGQPSSQPSAAVSPSPSAASPQASESKAESLSASATPNIGQVTETVAQTVIVTVTVQATQTVIAIDKGTPILITANKRRLKRSKPSTWYNRFIPRFFKRWLREEEE